MKTKKCSRKEMVSMYSMPSSSKEQNQSLKKEIEEGLSFDQCYIKVRGNSVVCRLVVYEEASYIAYFTVEDIEQSEIDDFLQTVCRKLLRSKEWVIDLYSDKIHHDKIKHAIQQQFLIEIQRESYVCKITKEKTIEHTFIPVIDCKKEVVLALLQQASVTTLDKILQRDIHRYGIQVFAENMYHELIEKEQSETLFQVFYRNQKAVGFISIFPMSSGNGAIGYIGVDAKQQGHHDSEILIKKAKQMAIDVHIHKLIADIDVTNEPIRTNLVKNGFVKDCNQCIFIREKD